MYLSDIASEGYYSPSQAARGGGGSPRDADSVSGGARRSSHAYPHTSPPAPPTSIPLDDNFDALTTEVPTEWAVGDRHADYDRDESVSGYRNYVTEMERMLSGQMENAARAQEHHSSRTRIQQQQQQQQQQQVRPATLRRSVTSITESIGGSQRIPGRRTLGSPQHSSPLSPQAVAAAPPPENARQVSGKQGQIELVEQRILEDSPARTISLWRERVAQSSAGGSAFDEDEGRSVVADSHAARGPPPGRAHGLGHRRVPSGSMASDARLRRVSSDHPRYAASVDGSRLRSESIRGTDNGKPVRASYERSEYMVSYQQPTKSGHPTALFTPRSELATLPRDLKTPSSPTLSRMYERTPPSPTLRRHRPRKSLDRSEFTMTYPQTPPHTGSQASSSSPPKNGPVLRPPVQGSFREDGGSALRATSTSSVEVILSSCDPSLIHIAPALYELGIKRVDHLRAIARLSEETRDREVKAQALKRGVTVVEWAIFLDKLQSL